MTIFLPPQRTSNCSAATVHGLAVLFVMPIAFMLIMSLALSRDQDPHTDSRIVLVGIANDSINTALAATLEKEQIHVTLMPSEKLTDAQNSLHDKRSNWCCTTRTTPPAKLPTTKPCKSMYRQIPSLRGWRRSKAFCSSTTPKRGWTLISTTTKASKSTIKNCPALSAKTSRKKSMKKTTSNSPPCKPF